MQATQNKQIQEETNKLLPQEINAIQDKNKILAKDNDTLKEKLATEQQGVKDLDRENTALRDEIKTLKEQLKEKQQEIEQLKNNQTQQKPNELTQEEQEEEDKKAQIWINRNLNFLSDVIKEIKQEIANLIYDNEIQQHITSYVNTWAIYLEAQNYCNSILQRKNHSLLLKARQIQDTIEAYLNMLVKQKNNNNIYRANPTIPAEIADFIDAQLKKPSAKQLEEQKKQQEIEEQREKEEREKEEREKEEREKEEREKEEREKEEREKSNKMQQKLNDMTLQNFLELKIQTMKNEYETTISEIHYLGVILGKFYGYLNLGELPEEQLREFKDCKSLTWDEYNDKQNILVMALLKLKIQLKNPHIKIQSILKDNKEDNNMIMNMFEDIVRYELEA
ncbi:hypothetical protein [Candidatus Phytoplasma ziziphi]|nr:hypothetical protein [Candidatus Phytoplasma ziziphi]